MVVGKGLVAKAFMEFQDDSGVAIFASGVSDSKTTDDSAFEKEFRLLKEIIAGNPEKLLVYFSTTSVLDPSQKDSPYCRHKLQLEKYIMQNCKYYLVIRVSNVIGSGGNPKTIFNYLKNKISSGESFEIWKNATRNLLDIDDLYRIVKGLISDFSKNKLIHVIGPFNISIYELVIELENALGRKGNYELKTIGISHPVVSELSDEQLHIYGVFFDKNYYQRVIQKYI